MLVFSIYNNGLLRTVDVPEDEITLLIEDACPEDMWDRSARNLESIKPTHRGLGVGMNPSDMGKRDFQAALKRPQLIPTFYLEDGLISINGYLYHKLVISD